MHDLMDQLAGLRSDLARSEADGVRARSIVADIDAARLEAERRLAAEVDGARKETERRLAAEVERAQERMAVLDREIAALHATKTMRLARLPRRVYAKSRRLLR